jgi:hypothetical protein
MGYMTESDRHGGVRRELDAALRDIPPNRRSTENYAAPVEWFISTVSPDVVYYFNVYNRAGHNFRSPLISPLFVDPLVNGTTLIFHI